MSNVNGPGTGFWRRRNPWAWGLGFLLVLFSAYSVYFFFEFVLWPRVPPELAGSWRVVGGDQDGVVLEFWPNGLFQATLKRGEEGAAVRGHVRVNGKQVHITSTDGQTGRSQVKTHVIRQLTPSELHLDDPGGVTVRLVRVE